MTDPTSGRYPPSLDQRTLRVAWQQVAEARRRLRSGDAITSEEREEIRRLLERLPEAMDDDDTTEPEPVI